MLVAYIFQISIIVGTVKDLMGEKQSICSIFTLMTVMLHPMTRIKQEYL
jgi:hypothetical protein